VFFLVGGALADLILLTFFSKGGVGVASVDTREV